MTSLLFLLALATFFATLFYWGFRHLPAEGWQIMAAVPSRREADGTWCSVNLTWYGFFNATSCVFSCAMVLLLMGSIKVPTIGTLAVVILLLLICVPAARVIARVV